MFLEKIISHRYFNSASTLVLIVFYAFFLLRHLTSITEGFLSPIVGILVLMETVIIVLLIFRKSPTVRAHDFNSIFFAFVGTFMVFLFTPSPIALNIPLGMFFFTVGGLCAVVSYLSLNTSFGITPALRSVKTNGLYKVVRHPMYFSYILIYVGYLLVSFSLLNLSVFVAVVCSHFIRTLYEEKILRKNSEYQTYAEKVPHRILPFIL
jgi:protein-S-isoprenylcysteine O-methyltransferase Ste14